MISLTLSTYFCWSNGKKCFFVIISILKNIKTKSYLPYVKTDPPTFQSFCICQRKRSQVVTLCGSKSRTVDVLPVPENVKSEGKKSKIKSQVLPFLFSLLELNLNVQEFVHRMSEFFNVKAQFNFVAFFVVTRTFTLFLFV